MNRNQMFVSGVVGTILVNGIVGIVKTVRDGRKEREQIQIQLEKDRANLQTATDRVLQKLATDHYRGKSLADIMMDWKFQMIVEGLND